MRQIAGLMILNSILSVLVGFALKDRLPEHPFQALKPAIDGGQRAEGAEIPQQHQQGAESQGPSYREGEGYRLQPNDGALNGEEAPRLGPRLRTVEEGPGPDALDKARLRGEWVKHSDGSLGFVAFMNLVRVPGVGGAWTMTPDAATWVPDQPKSWEDQLDREAIERRN